MKLKKTILSQRDLIISVILYFFLLINIVQAQSKIGFHLGMNLANGEYNYNKKSEIKISNKLGFTFGVLSESQIMNSFFLQPEINYIQKGPELKPVYDLINNFPISDSKESQSLNYIDLNFLLKFKLNKIDEFTPNLFTGFGYGVLLSAKTNLTAPFENTEIDLKEKKYLKSSDLSLIFGGGIEYAINKKIDLFTDIRYSLGVADINFSNNIERKNKGLQFLIGIKYCIFGCGEEQQKVEEIKKEVPPTISILKEFDLGKYDVPFFVSGYYIPNTSENLENLFEFKKTTLKNATYIENFAKNSAKYKQYKLWAQSVDNIFNTINLSFSDEIFPFFKKEESSSDTLEIVIYGYADSRPMSGTYFDDDTVTFFNKQNNPFSVNKGDAIDNFILSGLRAYNTGVEMDKIFSKNSLEYNDLKNSTRVRFKYISIGVDEREGEESVETQRKIKIVFSKIKNSAK